MKATPQLTVEQTLRAKLILLVKRHLELANENSERWLDLINELELKYRPPPVTVEHTEEKEFLPDGKSLTRVVDDYEREVIYEALERAGWNKTKAANLLGVTRRIFSYKIKILGIVDEDKSIEQLASIRKKCS